MRLDGKKAYGWAFMTGHGETIIGTKDGVIKARDVGSMEEKEAWDARRFNDIRGTPWEPVPGRKA